MLEEIKQELDKIKDCWETQDGIADLDYSQLEKKIFDLKENESFSSIMTLLISLRKKISLENDWQTEQWWKNISDFMAEQIIETINFIENNCSADDFILLSEIFEDITQKSNNKDFVRCIEKISKKYATECEEYNVFSVIQDCKKIL